METYFTGFFESVLNYPYSEMSFETSSRNSEYDSDAIQVACAVCGKKAVESFLSLFNSAVLMSESNVTFHLITDHFNTRVELEKQVNELVLNPIVIFSTLLVNCNSTESCPIR